MDYKKSTAPTNTVTRDVMNLCKDTDNIYESIAIIAKRANQISADIKTELNKKLQEFASPTDTLDETFENREQIEISRFYERLPKPTLMATEEFIEGKIFYRNPWNIDSLSSTPLENSYVNKKDRYDDTTHTECIPLPCLHGMRGLHEHGHRPILYRRG